KHYCPARGELKMTDAKPKRRWFRFSLRTLFMVLLLISLPLGWLGFQLDWIRQRHIFLRDYDIPKIYAITGPPKMPPWPLGYFKEEPVWYVTVRPEHLSEARRLFPESRIMLIEKN